MMSTLSERILAVDDEEHMRALFARALGREGYAVTCAASAEEALQRLETDWFDLVISDLQMAGLDGVGLLHKTKERHPALPFVLLTGFRTIDSAVAAMKDGAWDYLIKPIDTDKLLAVVKEALERRRLTREWERLRSQVAGEQNFPGIVGQSHAMQIVFQQIKLVAPSQSTVLIQGESGTGKELIARAIHEHSQRANRWFLALDCGSVHESLLDSELFGYVKGAFTGAHTNKKGLFEEAHGGTLFLDEINNTPFAFQAKLLRVLQEREIRPVGSTKSAPIDVRLIIATSQDLAQAAQQGTFRSDLYYRLAVVPLYLAPLRERREDIPLLVDHFIKKYCEREGTAPKRLAAPELQRLMDTPWPGNVRELENVIERAVVLSPGPVLNLQVALPLHRGHATPAPGQQPADRLPMSLKQATQAAQETLERKQIVEALRQTGNNRSAAAALLGISRGTLYNKLRRYGVKQEDEPKN
jgi:DNA-binding NtrC family response regulator